MNSWICIDVLVFIIVVLITGILIPQILLIAFRKNLLDLPDQRKIHLTPVPRLGGIAFFPAILFTILLAIGVLRQFVPTTVAEIPDRGVIELCFITCAVVILYLVGMADDLIGLKYRAKFVAQVIASVFIIIGHIRLGSLHGLFGIETLPVAVSVLLSILLTVFITNAINLIDGIDGLASGLSAVAFGFYGVVFFSAGRHVYGMMAFATLGALVPFFYYNVFGNAKKHGKIFMGDTGALTIGLLLSVMSIKICNISYDVFKINHAVVAFAPLLIPCCDVVRVYIHRIKLRRNPFLPDKTHIHHKLLALGMKPGLAMPTIIAVSLIWTLINCFLSLYINITVLFCLDLIFWTVGNMVLSRAICSRSRHLGKILYQ